MIQLGTVSYDSMIKFFGPDTCKSRHSGRSEAETRARSEAFHCYPSVSGAPLDSGLRRNDGKKLDHRVSAA